MPSSVTRPMGVAASSHFVAIAWTWGTRSAFATTSIRSCDSDSRISYGVIPGSRVGTSDRSISTPTPPLAAISADDEVRPAAPMSWMATMWPDAMSARLASSSNFSVNGSPTWTWPPPLALVRQLFGGERRAVDAVPAGARADDQQHVAHPARRRLDEVPFP